MSSRGGALGLMMAALPKHRSPRVLVIVLLKLVVTSTQHHISNTKFIAYGSKTSRTCIDLSQTTSANNISRLAGPTGPAGLAGPAGPAGRPGPARSAGRARLARPARPGWTGRPYQTGQTGRTDRTSWSGRTGWTGRTGQTVQTGQTRLHLTVF